MVVEFIKQLHQDSLEKAWNARPAKKKDPMPERREERPEPHRRRAGAVEEGRNQPGRGAAYQTRDNFNGVRVQLKYGQRPLVIDGRDHWFVEDAATFFKSAREAVATRPARRRHQRRARGQGQGQGPPSGAKQRSSRAEEQVAGACEGFHCNRHTCRVTFRTSCRDSCRVTRRFTCSTVPCACPPGLLASPAVSPAAPPAQDTSAVEPATARPGKRPRKYEKLLAAGIISEAAS